MKYRQKMKNIVILKPTSYWIGRERPTEHLCGGMVISTKIYGSKVNSDMKNKHNYQIEGIQKVNNNNTNEILLFLFVTTRHETLTIFTDAGDFK